MDSAILILLGVLVLLLILLLIRSFKPPAPSTDHNGLTLMQQQVDQLRLQLSEAMASNTGLMQ